MSENYKLDFTEVLVNFHDFITWKQSISRNDVDQITSEASCILIHDSLEEKENKDRLVAMAKYKNIPYCLFSNGFAATIIEGNSIKEIKKDRLYNNLLDFIMFYKLHSSIDLKILSLGQKHEIERASIIQDRLINGALLRNKIQFDYEATFPSGSQEYKDLKELVYLSDPSIDFSAFEDFNNSKITTAQSMRILIIELVKKVKQKYE